MKASVVAEPKSREVDDILDEKMCLHLHPDADKLVEWVKEIHSVVLNIASALNADERATITIGSASEPTVKDMKEVKVDPPPSSLRSSFRKGSASIFGHQSGDSASGANSPSSGFMASIRNLASGGQNSIPFFNRATDVGPPPSASLMGDAVDAKESNLNRSVTFQRRASLHQISSASPFERIPSPMSAGNITGVRHSFDASPIERQNSPSRLSLTATLGTTDSPPRPKDVFRRRSHMHHLNQTQTQAVAAAAAPLRSPQQSSSDRKPPPRVMSTGAMSVGSSVGGGGDGRGEFDNNDGERGGKDVAGEAGDVCSGDEGTSVSVRGTATTAGPLGQNSANSALGLYAEASMHDSDDAEVVLEQFYRSSVGGEGAAVAAAGRYSKGKRPPCVPPPLYHDGRMRRMWETLIICLVLFEVLYIPFSIAFQDRESSKDKELSLVVDALFVSDLLMSFATTYSDAAGQVVWSYRRIAAHYVTSPWFLIDFLSCIPFDLLAGDSFDLSIVKGLKLLRLVRLGKLFKWFDDMTKASVFRLARLVVLILYVLHWTACLWFLVAKEWIALPEVDIVDKSVFSQYCTCLFAATTLVFRNVHVRPVTNGEGLFATAMVLIGACLQASVFGSVAVLLASFDEDEVRFQKKVLQVSQRLHLWNVPKDLVARVQEYYLRMWEREKRLDADTERFFEDLSPALSSDLKVFLYQEMVEEIPFFKASRDRFAGSVVIEAVVMALQTSVYFDGDLVMRAGEVGDWMGFVGQEGRLAVLLPDDSVARMLSMGEYIGEEALLQRVQRSTDVVALTWTPLHILTQQAFHAVRADYPEEGNAILEQLIRVHLHSAIDLELGPEQELESALDGHHGADGGMVMMEQDPCSPGADPSVVPPPPPSPQSGGTANNNNDIIVGNNSNNNNNNNAFSALRSRPGLRLAILERNSSGDSMGGGGGSGSDGDTGFIDARQRTYVPSSTAPAVLQQQLPVVPAPTPRVRSRSSAATGYSRNASEDAEVWVGDAGGSGATSLAHRRIMSTGAHALPVSLVPPPLLIPTRHGSAITTPPTAPATSRASTERVRAASVVAAARGFSTGPWKLRSLFSGGAPAGSGSGSAPGSTPPDSGRGPGIRGFQMVALNRGIHSARRHSGSTPAQMPSPSDLAAPGSGAAATAAAAVGSGSAPVQSSEPSGGVAASAVSAATLAVGGDSGGGGGGVDGAGGEMKEGPKPDDEELPGTGVDDAQQDHQTAEVELEVELAQGVSGGSIPGRTPPRLEWVGVDSRPISKSDRRVSDDSESSDYSGVWGYSSQGSGAGSGRRRTRRPRADSEVSALSVISVGSDNRGGVRGSNSPSLLLRTDLTSPRSSDSRLPPRGSTGFSRSISSPASPPRLLDGAAARERSERNRNRPAYARSGAAPGLVDSVGRRGAVSVRLNPAHISASPRMARRRLRPPDPNSPFVEDMTPGVTPSPLQLGGAPQSLSTLHGTLQNWADASASAAGALRRSLSLGSFADTGPGQARGSPTNAVRGANANAVSPRGRPRASTAVFTQTDSRSRSYVPSPLSPRSQTGEWYRGGPDASDSPRQRAASVAVPSEYRSSGSPRTRLFSSSSSEAPSGSGRGRLRSASSMDSALGALTSPPPADTRTFVGVSMPPRVPPVLEVEEPNGGADSPLSAPPPPVPPLHRSQLQVSGSSDDSLCVLVVDDEESEGVAACHVLASLGISAELQCSPTAALEHLLQLHERAGAALPYDAVLIDVVMPGITGLELVSRLPPLLRQRLPVIMVDSAAHADDVKVGAMCRQLGAAAVLTKPLVRGVLHSVLCRAIPSQVLDSAVFPPHPPAGGGASIVDAGVGDGADDGGDVKEE